MKILLFVCFEIHYKRKEVLFCHLKYRYPSTRNENHLEWSYSYICVLKHRSINLQGNRQKFKEKKMQENYLNRKWFLCLVLEIGICLRGIWMFYHATDNDIYREIHIHHTYIVCGYLQNILTIPSLFHPQDDSSRIPILYLHSLSHILIYT